MFLFSNKEVLKASLLVDDLVFKKLLVSHRINAFSILFLMIGSWLVYQFIVIPNGESTPLTFWMLVGCSVVGIFLLIDAHFEKKFFKKLLEAQSNENLFSKEELRKIQASFAPTSEVSDRD